MKKHNQNTTTNIRNSGKNGVTYKNPRVKWSRNEPCHCGSGIKYKKCHMLF